jgi:16S rRNA (guanine527-N7)-methyltransferase
LAVFARVLEEFGQSPAQLELHVRHYELLERWNARMNLTRVVGVEAACRKHFAESLFLGRFLADAKVVLDVGSGGGFPGVPLAISRPDVQFVLAESVGKKAAFLREATRSLKNVAVFNGRADQVGSTFDCVVSRAVTPLEIASLLPLMAPYALMLMAAIDTGSTWNTLSPLPWDPKSVVAEFHVKPCVTF